MRVACLGECMLELSVSAAANQFGFGGDTLNTAAYLARELAATDTRVQFVTALGCDPLSSDMLDAWQLEGIDTGLVARLPGTLPGLYLIRTDAHGERSFFYWREQAAVRRLFDEGGGARLASTLAGCSLLYLSGITLAIFAAERRTALLDLLDALRATGTQIAFDTNYRASLWHDIAQARAAYASIRPRVDIALAGRDDEHALDATSTISEIVDRWLGDGAREVVVRCAEAGAWVAGASPDAGGQPMEVPVIRPLAPVDTTAAGDSFNAAYLAARLRGQGLRESVQAGHELAARVIMHAGAIAPARVTHPV